MGKREERKRDIIDTGNDESNIEEDKWSGIPKKLLEGPVISLFRKTKDPENVNDVFCNEFWKLKYANGCKYDCQWCELQMELNKFTKKGQPMIAPSHKDQNLKNNPKFKIRIEQHLREILEILEEPTMFNAGEVGDGLLFEPVLLQKIIPIFKEYEGKGHKLLILTKDDSVKTIMAAGAQKCVVFSYSINAKFMSRVWEQGAPNPIYRLAASRKAHDQGYETRLRLDPMVPVEGWKKGYRSIIEDIMRINPHATVITLGSLRGLQSTINGAKKFGKDLSWTNYLTDRTNWGLRVPENIRIEMYGYAIDQFRRLGYEGEIALCKETIGVWDALRLSKHLSGRPGEVLCNCVIKPSGPPALYDDGEWVCDTCGYVGHILDAGFECCDKKVPILPRSDE